MEHSVYIHMPFCRKRCHYCDFITFADYEDLIPAYIDALVREIHFVAKTQEKCPVHTIFFGGGTPSLIPLRQYAKILSALSEGFEMTEDVEISMEANPGTLSRAYLLGLRELGVNRLSLGVQSTAPQDLVRLDRIHRVEEILSSVREARMAGFDNINFDLIFGLPWQDYESWQHSLNRACSLAPDHLSIYSLIIEPGTPLHAWHHRGLIALENQDLQAAMYDWAREALSQRGFIHYEISNWAAEGAGRKLICRHNLQYWRNQPYFGFGTGAHGFVNQIRMVNVSTIEAYIERLSDVSHFQKSRQSYPGSPATISMTPVDKLTYMKDTMLLGLRLLEEGVSQSDFAARHQESMLDVFQMEIDRLLGLGLVTWSDDQGEKRLRLTPGGILVANQVFMAFV
jgi:oxygen-independent coproporphyrinogen-3 oxidase